MSLPVSVSDRYSHLRPVGSEWPRRPSKCQRWCRMWPIKSLRVSKNERNLSIGRLETFKVLSYLRHRRLERFVFITAEWLATCNHFSKCIVWLFSTILLKYIYLFWALYMQCIEKLWLIQSMQIRNSIASSIKLQWIYGQYRMIVFRAWLWLVDSLIGVVNNNKTNSLLPFVSGPLYVEQLIRAWISIFELITCSALIWKLQYPWLGICVKQLALDRKQNYRIKTAHWFA